MVYLYDGMLLSLKKNEIIPFVAIWMDLKTIVREGNGNPLQYSCLEIPWTEEPGGLQSMGLLGVRHDQ